MNNTGYQKVFANEAIPPSNVGFIAYTLMVSVTAVWPYNTAGADYYTARMMELTPTAAGISFTLPPADQVSTGESIVIRNIGAYPLNILDNAGGTLLSLASGVAQYLYVTDNTTAAGGWGQFTLGAGSSAVSSGALAGLGTKAIGPILGVAASCLPSATSVPLLATNRGAALEFTGGTATLSLAAVSGYGSDFYCYVKNAGTGLVSLTPVGGEFIDGQSSLGLQPNESLILMCNGVSGWYTVGYGRSTLYQFSQLTIDVSAGGTFTLTPSQASNKMISVVGNPATAPTIIVPSTVSVYYVLNSLSTAQAVAFKTASGTGVSITQSNRAVILCDGTNVTSAQTAPITTVITILDGTVLSPALNFASQSNTGFYKFSTLGIGLTVNGVAQYTSNGAGVEFPLGISQGGIQYKTSNTGSFSLPVGTTAQRDSPSTGFIRYNTTLGKVETGNGTAWTLGGGATGGGSDDVFYENSMHVTADYTITAGKNAMSAGPVITIDTGVTVTIPTGSSWSIV